MNQQIMGLLPFIVLIGVMWLFMIRPQQQQQKKRREMLEALKKGDRIITIGGIHGTIVDIGPESATIRIANNTEVTIERSAVGRVRTDESK